MPVLPQNVDFLATALSVPSSAVPVVVRLPPSLLQTATEFILAIVQVSARVFCACAMPDAAQFAESAGVINFVSHPDQLH